ncbi:MAG: hypothetical protein ACMUHX_02815 [bacterium]
MRLKIIAIFVVCIFLTLSILDTPEYVHCINPDLPDSLDLHLIVSNILNVKIISKAFDITFKNFISILENSLDDKEYFLPLIMLSDHLSSFISKNSNSYSEYPKQTFKILIDKNLVSEVTKLIGISIMRY